VKIIVCGHNKSENNPVVFAWGENESVVIGNDDIKKYVDVNSNEGKNTVW